MDSSNIKKPFNFRLSQDCVEKLDFLTDYLTKEIKVKFDKTMTIEYCIRWEYDRRYGTNKTNEFIENLSK